MVLPGIQALFGFQLIAVFNTGFGEKLTSGEQRLHLAAMLCEVVAVALVMAPAAAHRKREQGSVSRDFIELSSRLLLWSMIPLAGAISLDSYLVARIILGRVRPALAVGAGALAAFVVLWMLLPLRLARRSAWD